MQIRRGRGKDDRKGRGTKEELGESIGVEREGGRVERRKLDEGCEEEFRKRGRKEEVNSDPTGDETWNDGENYKRSEEFGKLLGE